MGLVGVLVDNARTVERRAAGQRVEGRTIYGTATGPWFKCRLTLPSALETDAEVVRPVQIVPTVLYGIRDENGDVVILHNDVRLEVGSKELGDSVWDVVGEPEPLRKKRRVIGWQATIRRVEVAVPA